MAIREALANVDFVGGWRKWFLFSGIFLLLGIGFIAIRGLNLGIDFEGGAKFTANNTSNSLSVAQVRNALPNDIAAGLGGSALRPERV